MARHPAALEHPDRRVWVGGVRIPQDISITGCDNTDLGATQTPALTTIRTPTTEIGRAAAEQVIARLEGQSYVAFQSLPFQIVSRGSVGTPAEGC